MELFMKKYCLFIFFLIAGIIFHLFKLLLMDREFSFIFDEVIFYIILVPVLEETIFRGGIQNYLKGKIPTFKSIDNIKNVLSTKSFISLQNIVTSLLFSMAHLFYFSLLHAFLVFFPSLIFGIVYDRYHNLFFPIFLHGIYNLSVFII